MSEKGGRQLFELLGGADVLAIGGKAEVGESNIFRAHSRRREDGVESLGQPRRCAVDSNLPVIGGASLSVRKLAAVRIDQLESGVGSAAVDAQEVRIRSQ